MGADLQPMAVVRGSLAAHAPAAGAEAVERVRRAAEPLRGARVLHLSGARAAGRVPELLSSLLPLAADAGLAPEWRVLFGGPELEAVARALQDGAQGAETAVEDAAWSAYLDACADAAAGLEGHDAVILHDPALLGMAATLPGRLVWRCHLDASAADPPLRERLLPLAERCAELAFPDPSFAPERLRERARSAPPGIDPLSPRNLDPAPRLAGRVVRTLGIDLSRPFVLQAMRLDRWKDPHAAMEAIATAREELPELRLVVALAIDPAAEEEWRAARELSDYAGDGVILLTSYEGVGNLELGALQRLARVALQLALREGFGLGASEALWKGTPVVGGRDGGVPLQVRDGIEGHLVNSPAEAAAGITELVRDPGLAVEMGRAGHERVRQRFLVTRALEDELRVLASALDAG